MTTSLVPRGDRDVFEQPPSVTTLSGHEGSESAPIIDLVTLLVNSAITSRASDVHIEPSEKGVLVRHRLDGILKEVMDLPRWVHEGLVARMKIMAGMDIAEKRLPQDGRLRVKTEDGTMLGGPMYALERGLGMKWLGVLFALFTVFASFGIGNMVQANSISTLAASQFGVSVHVSGLIQAVMTAVEPNRPSRVSRPSSASNGPRRRAGMVDAKSRSTRVSPGKYAVMLPTGSCGVVSRLRENAPGPLGSC